MDHEVISKPCEIYDWLLNSSRDNFGLHQGKNVKVTMQFEAPKDIFRGLHYPLQWILWWKRQKSCSGGKRQGLMLET